jgi:hypothetical protein
VLERRTVATLALAVRREKRKLNYFTHAGMLKVSTTEYTELQPLFSGVHSVMRVKLVLAGEGGGCTPQSNE